MFRFPFSSSDAPARRSAEAAGRRLRRRAGSVRLIALLATAAGAFWLGAAPPGVLRAWLASEGADSARGRVIAPGVAVRRLQAGLASVRVIDVDLAAPGVRVEVAADEIAVREGRITARARSVTEWLQATGAVAGINGGFFGETVGGYKEVLGLLKRQGRVRVAAAVHRARGPAPPGRRSFARSALGFTRAGAPSIAWVSSQPGAPQLLRRHPDPEATASGEPWRVEQALGCGPRLVREGRVAIAARAERLASPGALPRTFVGWGGTPDRARLLLCVADGMEFADCARFLVDYFRREGLPCRDGMALDGGASAQAAWRDRGRILAEPDPGTTVPTALLVHSR